MNAGGVPILVPGPASRRYAHGRYDLPTGLQVAKRLEPVNLMWLEDLVTGDYTPFVNADVIAQGLSGFDPMSAAMAAGRIMLQRLHELADKRKSFAFETTLASRSYAPWIRELKGKGYRFHLVYLWLSSADVAVARVAIAAVVVRRAAAGAAR
jgi:hypothetical protein